MLGRAYLQGADANQRPAQGKGERFGGRHSHTHPVKRAGAGCHGKPLHSGKSDTAFSEQALNAFEQLYTVVIAHVPGIFAIETLIVTKSDTGLAGRSIKSQE